MSAPTTHDPATVTTRDGMSWVRRAVTQDGRGLYAPEGVCNCPEFVMATLVELAEHGIKGQDPVADAVAVMGALPVPVGPSLLSTRTRELVEMEADRNRWKADAEKLRARVAELIQQRDRIANDTIKALAAGDVSARPVDEDPCRPCGCPKRFDRHAWGCPTLPADFVEALHASSGAVIEVPALPRAAAKCRCDEPGADPYACEADDCHGHFSELNPFGSGARSVNEGSAKVSRICPTCGWRTSVWHVADGSADAELHEHKVRAHAAVEEAHETPPRPRPVPHDLPEVTQ